MRIVIIEDEQHTAKDLAASILQVEPGARVIAILSSVKEAVEFFKENEGPDLVFSDIKLGDGLSFKIFDYVNINAPVIFCTAYDEYALQAFRAAGIDYILKPFTVTTIAAALAKYKALKNKFSKTTVSYADIGKSLERPQKEQAILVFYKDKILPVKIDDIAFFFLQNELTHLVTFSKQQYYINETLDDIEKLTGENFYRANRQYIVNKKAIKDVSKYFGRKLLLNLNISTAEKITVSKLKVNHFLAWLSGS